MNRYQVLWLVFSHPDDVRGVPSASGPASGRLRRAPERVQRPCYTIGMQNDILACLTRLSDAELVSRLKSLAARERHATAQLVAHIAELDTRDVYLREGYSSLFAYCTDALGLSEGETGNRIEAARAARRFPVILEMLASGAVSLTTVRLLAPHLTAANHRDALESARGKRKVEVQEIAARLCPRPDVPQSVRKLPAPRIASGEAGPAETPAFLPARPGATSPPVAHPMHRPPVRPPTVTPLSPDRYRLQLTIDGETLEKLRLAKDMLGHAIPRGDNEKILDRALTALLVELARTKFADTDKPRTSRGSNPAGRGPSAAVKRVVWVRDIGRCTYLGPTGHRCHERRCLEFHHVVPYALGGEATVENIVLMCRSHNNHDATLYFGQRTRKDGPGVVREEPASYGRQPAGQPANMFRNMLSGPQSDPALNAPSGQRIKRLHVQPGGEGRRPAVPDP